MSKTIKKIILAFLSVLFCSGFITYDNDLYFEINKGIDLFGKIYRNVTLNYVDEINPKEFVLAGIEGMLQSLDPYSNYIDINEQNEIDLITKGKYGGIGAAVGLRNDEVTVVDLIEGAPAQRQGLKIGDIIKKIDKTEINKDNFSKLSTFLKGEVGSSVNIIISRNGEEINFNLIREEIEIKNVSLFDFIPGNSNNAYIKLSGFSQSAGEEVKQAIIKLKSQKEIESLILDLRGNPGGLLDAAIDVSEKFLPKGSLIVSVKGRDSLSVKKYYAKEEPLLNKEKIIVLVDDHTASAAEIVAGALQDHDRAVIVGENSFGKGLVQTIIPLPYGSSLKLTTAKYFTPSGRCIQKIEYSKNNKVFNNKSSQIRNEYFTDNKRKVFASGGILPDSIIKSNMNDNIISRLKAEGLFFRYATNFFNNNKVAHLNDSLIFKDFRKYLDNQKFSFISKSEKTLKQLTETINQEKFDSKKVKEIIKDLEKNFELMNKEEILKYQNEILSEIKIEFAARLNGKNGRLIESLKSDIQFQKALEIIKNQKIYYALLNYTN